MQGRSKLSRCRVPFLLVVLAALTSSTAMGQETPAPKAEIFAGYAWIDPGVNLRGQKVGSIPAGYGVSGTFNFGPYFGLTLDTGGHRGDRANIATLMGGPTVTFRSEHVWPFIHALGGLYRLAPAGLPPRNGAGFALGGGFDINLTPHWNVRLIEADYMWGHHNFFPTAVGSSGSPRVEPSGARLRTGIVYLFPGGPPPAPPTASCSAQPTEVMAGEPVQVTATPNFPKGRTLTYNWTATGGKVTGKDQTASVDTAGLAAGSYTVTAQITDNKKNMAQCSANFTVKEPVKNPPTISCSANPTTVRSGDPSAITSTAASPDNRPVTVTYTATGGKITGSGNTATLDTAGAPAGTITVTCTATDDRNLSTSATTTVNVEVPPPPPTASKLNEIAFKANNARVDNTAKAILDDVALRLQRDADAKAVVVGNSDPSEKGGSRLAAQRAVNTKAYLTQEKGIDASRIEPRSATGGGMKAEIFIVPPGASFDQAGTTPVDESKVKPGPAKAPVRKRAPRKPASKPAAAAPKR